tara:strand:- start:681 stop:1475 length:795 start_codon:yes stop_codon:yes gene_type:complete
MDEKDVDKCIDTFGDMIKLHVKKFLYEKPSTNGHLRLSSIGKPDRQLWYNLNIKKEETLTPSTRIKFLYGYILEEFLLLCSSIAGHTVTHQQKEVEVGGVKGHQDAMIDDVLVDCKSSSGISFQKFKSNALINDDPFGYIAQISAYAEANGVDEAAFLVIDKSTGDICLTPVHSMEMINADKRIKHLKKMVTDSNPPDRCYDPVPDGKSGNYKLAIGCIYCSHKRECWKDINDGKGLRVFEYAKGKRYLVQVRKEPDVLEVVNW